ncbi:MAG: glucosaminidase domain-containing protein [Bacteroidales bacterium]|nr:glucosaminidase domain-containing protein [Bacteroidales bacterium]
MKKSLLFSFSVILFVNFSVRAQYTEADIYRYIETYKEIAIDKMEKYKIPASITLAQGIFESACGTSKLATEGKNHFGIKCHGDWRGDTIHIDDDQLQECFRKYEKVEDSYNDHSLFLTTRNRYKSLFSLATTDYAGWARGLKQAGYATNPQYADRLINLIETYNISHIDTLCLQREGKLPMPDTTAAVANGDEHHQHNHSKPHEEIKYHHKKHDENAVKEDNKREQPAENNGNATAIQETTQTPVPVVTPNNTPTFSQAVFTATNVDFPSSECPWTNRPVFENNRVQFVIATSYDTYKSIAAEVQRSEKELLSYNEAFPNSKLIAGQVVYIEPKGRKLMKTHTVQQGETLRFISQKYAIQLKMLYHYNDLSEESIIKPGDKIKMSN